MNPVELPFVDFSIKATRPSLVLTPLPEGADSLVSGTLPSSILADWREVRLTPAPEGTSGVWFMSKCGIDRATPYAVVKLRQDEPGSERQRKIDPDALSIRCGCPPGTGAFIEVIASLYIQSQLDLIPELEKFCIVPCIAYAQMGHSAFKRDLDQSYPDLPPSIRGTGSIQEYIQPTSSSRDGLLKANPLALEFMAVMDIVLLNSDRHLGNILFSDPAIVMIDHALVLPQGGKDARRFAWVSCPVLQGAPSERIRKFIQTINVATLQTIGQNVSAELADKIAQLPEQLQRGELQQLEADRIIPHQIAITLLKRLIATKLSLSDIGQIFIGTAIQELYDQVLRGYELETVCSQHPCFNQTID